MYAYTTVCNSTGGLLSNIPAEVPTTIFYCTISFDCDVLFSLSPTPPPSPGKLLRHLGRSVGGMPMSRLRLSVSRLKQAPHVALPIVANGDRLLMTSTRPGVNSSTADGDVDDDVTAAIVFVALFRGDSTSDDRAFVR